MDPGQDRQDQQVKLMAKSVHCQNKTESNQMAKSNPGGGNERFSIMVVAENEAGLETLKVKLSESEFTEEENASLIFQAGYVQALKDIVGIKNG